MYEDITIDTMNPSNYGTYGENDAQLVSTETEAVLSWNGTQLIHFLSPVKVRGEEILDWMNKGILEEVISLENTPERNGLRIMAREIAPFYLTRRSPGQERSTRRLLLNPQWFSVYFISDFNPFLPEMEEAGLREIYNRLLTLFKPGTAMVDYANFKVYLRLFKSITAPPVA